jgi:protein tyrosine/serine phosphatase
VNNDYTRRITFCVSCLLLFLLVPLAFVELRTRTPQLSESARPQSWAQPLKKEGLPNLHQVSPILFRGAQPSHEGMVQLEQMGVKTIVNLRGLHDDEDRINGTKLSYVSIHFHTLLPEEGEMVKFLKTITQTNSQPVFVHCNRGIDRTGTMVALYRIAVQGWTKEEAVREMTEGGFGYDDMFPNLVRYVKGLDVAALQKKAGILR